VLALQESLLMLQQALMAVMALAMKRQVERAML
jgi:hypothetical protein